MTIKYRDHITEQRIVNADHFVSENVFISGSRYLLFNMGLPATED
jgi:hypothetical protein